MYRGRDNFEARQLIAYILRGFRDKNMEFVREGKKQDEVSEALINELRPWSRMDHAA